LAQAGSRPARLRNIINVEPNRQTPLHPQTILASKYAGDVLADPFGYPLRLRTSTKLGYKNAKWIKAIEVTNDFRETFWSKQGFNWFAGI